MGQGPRADRPVRHICDSRPFLHGTLGKIQHLEDALRKCRVEVVCDFRRFYNLNLPDDIKRYEPSYLCDLLDGLEGIDGSMYRAWLLQYEPVDENDKSERGKRRLSYLSFSQDSALFLEMANTLETLRVMLALYMGDKKAQPDLILPPGVDAIDGVDATKRSMSTAGMSISQISGMLHGMFGGNGAG